MLAFMGLPGGSEWLIALFVALLLFGTRLPSVMRSLGKSVTEFKKGLREVEDDVESAGKGDDDEQPDDRPPSPAG